MLIFFSFTLSYTVISGTADEISVEIAPPIVLPDKGDPYTLPVNGTPVVIIANYFVTIDTISGDFLVINFDNNDQLPLIFLNKFDSDLKIVF